MGIIGTRGLHWVSLEILAKEKEFSFILVQDVVFTQNKRGRECYVRNIWGPELACSQRLRGKAISLVKRLRLFESRTFIMSFSLEKASDLT